ncbi:MAG TPA: iron-sulfur cluster-binding domain-containing protein [Clostridia bacterium]|nr:iron-sulfur cluster-binding domain-containing protein [Clostridia bacterium]
MREDTPRYAVRMDISKFGQIMPKRMAHIMPAPATPPRCDYAANLTAKALHPKKQYLTVSKVTPRCGAVQFTLSADRERGTDKLALFRAGQFLSFRMTIGHSVLTRPYSICSAPSDAAKGFYEICVKTAEDGFAGNWICQNWQVGTKVEATAPMGEFCYEELRDAPAVLGAAGGSGITPFLSMARAIAEGGEDFSLTLLYGSRDSGSILFKEELDAIAAACDKVKVVHVLSDEAAEGCEHGVIDARLIEKYAPETYSLFVCGSGGMSRFVCAEAKKLSLTKKYLREKIYNATVPQLEEGWDTSLADKRFTLTLVTKDETYTLPCSAMETVLVAVERAGVLAPSGCRSGECGMCRSRLASGEVFIPGRLEHRKLADRVYGYIHPCCAFPMSDLTLELEMAAGEAR